MIQLIKTNKTNARGGPSDSGGPRPTFTGLPAFTARRGAPALALGGAIAHLATPVRTRMAETIFNGLPDKFEQILLGIRSSSGGQLTTALVKERLLPLDSKSSESTDSALASKSLVPVCHNCNQEGHIKPRCPRLRKKKKSQVPKVILDPRVKLPVVGRTICRVIATALEEGPLQEATSL